MRHIKRSSVERWIEIVGETGVLEPNLKLSYFRFYYLFLFLMMIPINRKLEYSGKL